MVASLRQDMCAWSLVACAALAFVGCSNSDRCSVSGAISWKGQPVDGGNVQLESVGIKPVVATGALVQAGRYSIPSESGLLPGQYSVRIYCAEKPDEKLVSTIMGGAWKNKDNAPPKELIPAKYNAESELTIEVKEGTSNTFDFALK